MVNFDFNYQIDEYKKCIERTERDLRDIIYKIMTRKFGSDWETDQSRGWISEKIDELKQKAKQSIENSQTQPRLIDFCDMLDLRDIIKNNWNVFSPIFSSKDILMHVEELNSYRVPPAHSRELQSYQQHACIGLCGKICSKIYSWNEGFGIQIKKYDCEFRFDSNQVQQKEVLDEQTQEKLGKNSKQTFQNWLSNISKLGKLEQKTPNELILRAMGSHLVITTNQPTRSSTGSEQWMSNWARTVTENKKLLDQVIKIGNHPYSVIHWVLNSEFDIDNIVKKVKDLTGITPGSSGATVMASGTIIGNATYGIANVENSSIRILLATENNLGKISIQRDGGPNTGFTKAHLVITPDDILSKLLGEMAQVKFIELIRKSCELD